MPCDYKRYPKDWKQIRAAILEREGNRCKFCGVENGSVLLRCRSHPARSWRRRHSRSRGQACDHGWAKSENPNAWERVA